MVKKNNKTFSENLQTALRIAILSKAIVILTRLLKSECAELVTSKTNLIHKKTATLVSKAESMDIDCADVIYTYQNQPRLVGPDVFAETDANLGELVANLNQVIIDETKRCYSYELSHFDYKRELCEGSESLE